MDYKIIASDLDGTLLNTKKEISHENIAAITELARLGVSFVPCSGRTLSEIPCIVRDIPAVRYIIHSDGAVIYDKATGERIERCMKKELSAKALDILFEYENSITVRHNGESYFDANAHSVENYNYHRVNPLYQKMMCETGIPASDFKRFCYELSGIEMICIHFHSDEDLNECKQRLSQIDGLSVTRLAEESIEVYDVNAGKGNGLLRLAEHLGVDKHQTICVGDSGNDLDMLKKSGLALVMSNGLDIAKKEADAIICSNDEHAAEYILRNYII